MLTNSSRCRCLLEHLTQSVGVRLYQNSVPGGVILEATSKCLPRTDAVLLPVTCPAPCVLPCLSQL